MFFLVNTFIILLFEQSNNKLNYKPTFEEFNIYMYCFINNTAKYFHFIGLYINTSKTEYYSFERSLKISKTIAKTSVFIDVFQIKEVTHTNVLGIEIHNHLNLNLHVENLRKKISSSIYIITKVSKFGNHSLNLKIYYRFFQYTFKQFSTTLRLFFTQNFTESISNSNKRNQVHGIGTKVYYVKNYLKIRI